MNQQTLAAIRDWTNNNKGNQAVAGAANDLFYNSLSSQLQTDSDASYAKTMMPLLLEQQEGTQRIATEADMRRIWAEGGVIRDLQEQQGRIQTGLANINSGDVRYISDRRVDESRIGADAQVRSTQIGADATRDVADTQLQGTRYTADAGVRSTQIGADAQVRSTQIGADAQVRSTQIGADAQRYGYDTQLAGTRYSADRQVDSTRIGADAQVRSTQIGADAQRYGDDTRLAGVKATNFSQEEQRRIQGGEDRKTLTQGTDETLRLRADARGAIASTGRRFFG
jgi:hypothetical protein